MPPNDRIAEVGDALRHVTDPELDESVVDLGFISAIEVDGDEVAVRFRLPTFWCSPNFAWIMAEDMRDALARLEWVRRREITLVDHVGADAINAAINAGEGFAEAHGAESGGDLSGLRAVFRRKAFLGRMATLIEALRTGGWSDGELLGLTVGELPGLDGAHRLGLGALPSSPFQGAQVVPPEPDRHPRRNSEVSPTPPPPVSRAVRGS